MQSANSLALQELNKIRNEHKFEQSEHIEEVRTLAPEYSEIEIALLGAGKNLLKSVLNGGNNFDSIKEFIQRKQADKLRILKHLSLPADYLEEKVNCENCSDTGFDDNGLKCVCLKQLTEKYIVVNSNLTDNMKSQTFDNFNFSLFSAVPDSSGKAPLDIINSAYKISMSFANNFDKIPPQNILLRGNAGTGKTYLSSCIGNAVLERGKTVYYQTAYKLCELLENIKFGKYSTPEDMNSARSTVKYINDVDLLIIDDLGTEFATQFTSAALFDLLNTRLIKSKSTIISTNLDFTTMENMYSTRFTSRIIGEYLILILIGKDLRKSNIS